MRCEIGCRKNLDFGLCMLYLCSSEVRLHLSITFENEFSSSAFGLHWHCSSEVRLHCTLISCTLALTDEKTVFLFYSFSVLWHGVTTESRAGRPVWNPNMPLGFTLCFFMKVFSFYNEVVWTFMKFKICLNFWGVFGSWRRSVASYTTDERSKNGQKERWRLNLEEINLQVKSSSEKFRRLQL